jgi:hypothetical protein
VSCLKPGEFRRPSGAAWFAEDIVLRQLATAAGLLFVPERAATLMGHRDDWAKGKLERFTGDVPPISAVMLTRPNDERTGAAVKHALGWAAEVVLVIDGEEGEELAFTTDGSRPVWRRLKGDFGAQRNAGQEAARCAFALHLDTDEVLQVDSQALSLLIHIMQRDDLRAVGFPRRNLVGGELSALYPDVQYRLVRREERFVGTVHERPAICESDWTKTMIGFGGHIDHQISRQHVLDRRERYDAAGQSDERRAEAELLLTPFPGRVSAA